MLAAMYEKASTYAGSVGGALTRVQRSLRYRLWTDRITPDLTYRNRWLHAAALRTGHYRSRLRRHRRKYSASNSLKAFYEPSLLVTQDHRLELESLVATGYHVEHNYLQQEHQVSIQRDLEAILAATDGAGAGSGPPRSVTLPEDLETIERCSWAWTQEGPGVSVLTGLVTPAFFRSAFSHTIALLDSIVAPLKIRQWKTTLVIHFCHGEDQAHKNARWHFDRSVPNIKAFYYPIGTEADQAPIGYCLGTQRLDERFLDRYLGYAHGQGYESPQDVADLESGRLKKEELVVPPDTLIVAATHGLHRRTPFTRPGRRIVLVMTPLF